MRQSSSAPAPAALAGVALAGALLVAALWQVPGSAAGAATMAPARGTSAGTAAATASSVGPTASSVGADHRCVVGPGRPRIAWSRLRNPILSSPDAAEKDEAIVWYAGRWHMIFSYARHDRTAPGGVRWDIATATSTDLSHWSAAELWPRQPEALGTASPDVVRAPDGLFVVTYQSDPGQVGGAQDRLYYRTSRDLEHWSAPHPLAQNLAPAPRDRMIDGALAFTGGGAILGFKWGTTGGTQVFEIAWSPRGSLAGPWQLVGRPDVSVYGQTVENYEFVGVGGHWDLVATTNILDQPWLFTLAGDPARPSGWLRWDKGRQLEVPAGRWDSAPGLSSVTHEVDNSAFLCVDPADGTDYLLYAGSDELTQFGGWGHAEIGIAASNDLVHWKTP